MTASMDFLKPRSVAVIGASRDPAKRGNRAIRTLIDCGYSGKVLPINPKETEILGLACYADLAAAPGDIDLALICTPARAVPEVLELCGARGVRGALVLAGGFSEAGPEGVAISLLAQSHQNGHAGFTTFIGVGNEGDIQFHEYLRFFGDDPNTGVVVVYAEGFKNGRAFLEVVREVAVRKPVVLYKAGRTDTGERAARSHSGSLAGNYPVASAALRQAGVILVERSDEMFAVADMVSRTAGRPTCRVAVLSEGGGPIAQAVDALTERGLGLPRLAAETEARLKAITPAATQLSNPVDAGGGTDPHPRYMPLCSQEILADPAVDALLIVGYFGGYEVRYGASIIESETTAARELVSLARKFGKPVIVQGHYAEFSTQAMDILRAGDVIVVRSIEIAAACLAGAERFHRVSSAGRAARSAEAPLSASDTARRLIGGAQSEGRRSLLEPEALQLLASHGVEVPPFALLRAPAEAMSLPASLTQAPVALKIVSKDILHKSDVGGVRLGFTGAKAIEAECAALLADMARTCPAAEIAGVLVTPMAGKGVEVIIGAAKDPQFGPILMFGLGGVFVEVLKDVVFRTLPLDREEAGKMLDEVRGKALLEGVRGNRAVDREKLVSLLLDVSRIVMANPEITEIDLNPVIVSADGYAVVDARMLLA